MPDKYDLTVNFALSNYEVRGVSLNGIMPGQILEGEALLNPYEDVNCRGLWLEIGYWDRGRGTPHENRLVQDMFYQGNLQRNQAISHRIQFQIPDRGPVTYAGENVNIDWFVRIRVDIPMWFDKRYEYPFNVIPRFIASREEVMGA